MKTFTEFLMEAVKPDLDKKSLEKDAIAMWKALKFKKTDINNLLSVSTMFSRIDTFYHGNDLHKKWSPEGVRIALEFTEDSRIFWMLETCFECPVKDAEGWDSDDDPITVKQAREEFYEDSLILTGNGTVVGFDYNMSNDGSELENITDEKIKKIIEMMCKFHKVKYNPEVFRIYEPSDFTFRTDPVHVAKNKQ